MATARCPTRAITLKLDRSRSDRASQGLELERSSTTENWGPSRGAHLVGGAYLADGGSSQNGKSPISA